MPVRKKGETQTARKQGRRDRKKRVCACVCMYVKEREWVGGARAQEHIEGFRPAWYISTTHHAWDTPFWLGTLEEASDLYSNIQSTKWPVKWYLCTFKRMYCACFALPPAPPFYSTAVPIIYPVFIPLLLNFWSFFFFFKLKFRRLFMKKEEEEETKFSKQ